MYSECLIKHESNPPVGTHTFVREISLGHLELGKNVFSGSIPSELARIKSLQSKLDLSHNQLTGSLPTELGMLVDLSKCRRAHDITV
jgi:hypothetical protein